MNNEISKLKQLKIGVLAGGSSSERKISLKSGRAVSKALRNAGLDTVFIDAKEEELFNCIDEACVDIAFIALHGKFGEDGTVQRMLDEKNIAYTGSGPESSFLALDKLASRETFIKEGLCVPGYRVVCPGDDIAHEAIHFPCVVKPRYEGSSFGLSIVSSREYVQDAIERAEVYGDETIIEDFIPGREMTVGILGGHPLPVVEIITENEAYDFDAKYQSGDTKYIVPAHIGKDDYRKLQEEGLKAHRALGCKDFSRVDFRYTEDGKIFVLEVNTIPGLTERSLLPMAAKVEGMDFSELCVKMLSNALKEDRP